MKWFPTPGAMPRQLVFGLNGALWFTELNARRIGRLDTHSGKITEFPLPGVRAPLTEIATGPDGGVWFSSYEPSDTSLSTLGTISPDGSVRVWPSPFGVASLAVGPDGMIWLGGEGNGKIARVASDGTTREVQACRAGSESSRGGTTISLAPGPDPGLWAICGSGTGTGIGGSDEAIYAQLLGIAPLTQTVTSRTKLRPGRSYEALVAGEPNRLWLMSLGGFQEVRPDRSIGATKRISFRGGDVRHLNWMPTLASDGKFWAGQTDDSLGPSMVWTLNQLDPSTRRVTAFFVASRKANNIAPPSIASGPDQRLWFSYPAGRRIGRMDLTAPTVTIPYSFSRVVRINRATFVSSHVKNGARVRVSWHGTDGEASSTRQTVSVVRGRILSRTPRDGTYVVTVRLRNVILAKHLVRVKRRRVP